MPLSFMDEDTRHQLERKEESTRNSLSCLSALGQAPSLRRAISSPAWHHQGALRNHCSRGSCAGFDQFVRDQLQAKIAKVEVVTEALSLLKNPQIEFALLSSCLALRKFMFFLRTADTSEMEDILSQFDTITREALSRIIAFPLTDLQWRQAKLPCSLGGVGL